MKIAVCSDLHLEFGPITLENTENADVLILSGDICVAKDLFARDQFNVVGQKNLSNALHEFFTTCCEKFNTVIYVAGNHEHYHGDFAKTLAYLKENLGYLAKLHILDKETVTINGVLFVGGTLWTDMNKEDPITLMHMTGMMNDFRCVQNSNRKVTKKVPIYKKDENGKMVTEKVGHINTTVVERHEFKEYDAKFSPEDAVEDHKKMIDYLKIMVEGKNDKKIVVVGHHSPSKQSTHPRYKDEHIMNGGYSSDLSEFILDHPQIKLWTHGHTHEDFDYMIGSTRVVCNPRGYINYESRADDFKLKIVEI